MDWNIFRTFIICGRLMEPPYYAIPRFMAFFLFAHYARMMQSRFIGSAVRLHVPEKAVINIVPADFVAKTVVALAGSPVQQLNIVHPENVPCRSLFRNGFKLIKFDDFDFLEEVSKYPSFLEKILYATIGQQLGPYMDTPEHHFDTRELFDMMPDVQLPGSRNTYMGCLNLPQITVLPRYIEILFRNRWSNSC